MPDDSENPGEYQTATTELSLAGRRLRMELSVPTGRTRPAQLLPIFRALSDSVVGLAIESAEAAGETVSCRQGCAACCRQLIPISEMEAYRLRDLVQGLPEPRRSQILARFEAARSRLEELGMLARLAVPNGIPDEQLDPLGMEFFTHLIPWPFLEEESCSIHPERPIACREYLVTSPAANCWKPSAGSVKCVKMPAEVLITLSKMGGEGSDPPVKWVPLILAMAWAEEYPERLPSQTGAEIVTEFFNRLTGREIPAQSDSGRR